MIFSVFIVLLSLQRRWFNVVSATSAPSSSPTTLESYVHQALASQTQMQQQDKRRLMALLSNETTARETAMTSLNKALDDQEAYHLWAITNLTHQLFTLKTQLIQEAGEKETTFQQLIHTLQQETNQCLAEHDALINHIDAIENQTTQWHQGLHQSLAHERNRSTHRLSVFTATLDTLSIDTDTGLRFLEQSLHQDIRITNTSLYSYLFTAWQSLEQDIQRMSLTLTDKINRDARAIQHMIDSLRPNVANDTTVYLIPEADVTRLVTKQVDAIKALEDPEVQEARRLFDVVISCKELTFLLIALFNALILVAGMSVLQSLYYTFRLTDKKRLDRLRQGTTGPVGPQFFEFITSIERIIIESTFTPKESSDRLIQLSEIQAMKNDSLSLFSSLHSMSALRLALQRSQELSAIGLLRQKNPSRILVAQKIYDDYAVWRQVHQRRILIYRYLQAYPVPFEPNKTLARHEKWRSRAKHRDSIHHDWAAFKKRLPETLNTPTMLSPATLMLKIRVECDEKTSPDFSRYLHQLHNKLCLIHEVPGLIEDVYVHIEGKPVKNIDTTLQAIHAHYPEISIDRLSNSVESRDILLKEARECIDAIHRLTTPQWPIFFASTPSQTELTHRQTIAHQLHDLMKRVITYLEQTAPLFIAWMDAYAAIATRADAALESHLTVIADKIPLSTEDRDEYTHKYHDIVQTLSSHPGLPGLIDLIDLSYHLGLNTDQCHLSSRASARRVSPTEGHGVFDAQISNKPDIHLTSRYPS